MVGPLCSHICCANLKPVRLKRNGNIDEIGAEIYHSEDDFDGESCQNELSASEREPDTALHTAPPMSSCVSGEVSSRRGTFGLNVMLM